MRPISSRSIRTRRRRVVCSRKAVTNRNRAGQKEAVTWVSSISEVTNMWDRWWSRP